MKLKAYETIGHLKGFRNMSMDSYLSRSTPSNPKILLWVLPICLTKERAEL